MGIWLGVTGIMLKEIWMGEWMEKICDIQGLHALKSICAAHLMVTIAVLLIIMKLGLEYSRYIPIICKMTEKASRKEYQLNYLWKMLKLRKKPEAIFKSCFTLGGITSLILISGISLDFYILVTSHTMQDRYIGGLIDSLILFVIVVVIFVLYELIFMSIEGKLKKNMGFDSDEKIRPSGGG